MYNMGVLLKRWLNNRKKRWANWCMFFGLALPNYGWGLSLRGYWMRLVMKNSGKSLKISGLVNFYNPSRVVVGNNVYIGHGTYLGDGDISIDDEVVIGPNCVLSGGNHLFKNGSVRFGGYEYIPISIGRGTWIGGNCTITAGSRVGKGCIIAAGSVVTNDIPDGVIAGGIPAKVIKENNLNSGKNSDNQQGMTT